jgi:hypothetical protein
VFVLSDVHGTPISREEMGDLRFQEGTWVVVNSLLNDEGQPRAAWEIVRGRLGVIHVISDAQITVQLQRLSFKPTPFGYPHRRTDPQPGQVYTLDEMVDDLNADKYLEACQHAASNPLYRWLNAAYTGPQAPKPLRVIRPSRLPSLARAVDTVERFQGGERELIIVSATVSDLAYAQSESDFLLEPRRLTVAVSRPKRKLIVLASQALFTP